MLTPAELFSLLSDETRLRSLFLLRKEEELCVCEFGQILGSHQPKISRHLALLRRSGLVTDERRGQWVYYRMSEDLEGWAEQILTAVLQPLGSIEPYKSDAKSIARCRKDGPCS